VSKENFIKKEYFLDDSKLSDLTRKGKKYWWKTAFGF
jgi:hypothetical protein